MNYRADIEGLRAVAVIAVVIFHFYPSILPGGFIGVDVFFVLSGYLITSKILKEKKINSFRLINFYIRRIIRLFPALCLVLLVLSGAGYFIFLPDELIKLAKNTISGIGFYSNFALSKEAGYFTQEADFYPLLNLWSLGVEEQFYIIWPVFLLVFCIQRRYLILLILIITVGSFAYAISIDDFAQKGFYSPLARCWEIIIGALFAYYPPRTKYKFIRPFLFSTFLSSVGVIFIIGSFYLVSASHANSAWYAVCPVVGTILIIAGGRNSTINRLFLSNKVMCFIGAISYPLYLWHWPIYSISKIVNIPYPYWIVSITFIAISFLLAYATYRFIEQPIRVVSTFYPVIVSSSLLIVMSLLCIYSILVINHNGFPGRIDKEGALINQYGYDEVSGYRVAKCTLDSDQDGSDFADECNASKQDKTQVFIWGDSTASHLYPGLNNLLPSDKYVISQYTASACKPFVPTKSQEINTQCASINATIVDKLLFAMPDILILSAYVGNSSQDDLDRLINAASFAKENGVSTVVVIGPNIKFFDSVPKIIARNKMIDKSIYFSDIELDRDTLRKSLQVDKYLELKSIEIGFRYVSTMHAMCNYNMCKGMFYGVPAYWDSMHLTDGGSLYLAHFVYEVATAKRALDYTKISLEAKDASLAKITTLEEGAFFKIKTLQARSFAELGNDAILKNKPQDAINYYTKAIELDSMKPVYYAKRGDVYGQVGNLHNAYLDYSIFVQMIRNKAGKIFGLRVHAQLAEALNLWDEALKDYDELLLLSPRDDAAKIKRVAILKRISDK